MGMAEAIAHAARDDRVRRCNRFDERGRRGRRAAVVPYLEQIGAEQASVASEERVFFAVLGVAHEKRCPPAVADPHDERVVVGVDERGWLGARREHLDLRSAERAGAAAEPIGAHDRNAARAKSASSDA